MDNDIPAPGQGQPFNANGNSPESPMDDDPNMNGPSDNSNMGGEFDSNFDAGIDADEDADPKKYIQQLTGKLSQKLRSFNQEEQDSDLNKYVLGMIAAQAGKGLDDEDKKDVIAKLQNPDTVDDNMDSMDMNGDNEMPSPDENEKNGDIEFDDNNGGIPRPQGIENPGMDKPQKTQKMESRHKKPIIELDQSLDEMDKKLDEILSSIMGDEMNNTKATTSNSDSIKTPKNKKKTYRNKPFSNPNIH